jgi:hypothetical protein
MHVIYENSTNPSIHANCVECNFFPWPSKFEMNMFNWYYGKNLFIWKGNELQKLDSNK